MQTYIATFTAGCQEIVIRQLKRLPLLNLKIISNDESSVKFESDYPIEKLIEFRFFTNVFMLLSVAKLSSIKPYIKSRSFRLLGLVNGEPTQIEKSKRDSISKLIKRDLGLIANASNNSVDFVLIKRRSGNEELTLRLSRAKHKRQKLPDGALRPELANILLLVAGVKARDTLLDPYAGYGSIPLEALKGFGLTHIMAIDNDPKLVIGLRDKGLPAKEENAQDLKTIVTSSIDRIVTDPPWGIYINNGVESLEDLYRQSLKEMVRVLKPRGIAVILSGSKILDSVIEDTKEFELIKGYPILVSGKKATILKLQLN